MSEEGKGRAVLWSVLGLGLAVLLFGAVAGPKFGAVRARDRRDELARNVNAIRKAELAYLARTGEALAVERTPEGPLGKKPRPWAASSPFDALDWRPHEEVRGAYWVERGGFTDEFTVHGVMDADGDGEEAHYLANRAEPAQMISLNNVY